MEAAIKAGARTINIPDTVGYTVPDEFRDLIRMLRNRVPNMDQAIISVHCHNDLGLAVANSLAAVEAGARQVECTINGIGERAGNAALEEIVMALKTRQDMMPFETGIDSSYITKASRLVSGITGFNVQPNKAIVGKNAFAHESGIHQDGMLKNAETYEIMTPESVGLKRSTLVMGRHSGKHAFKTKLKELGYETVDNELKDAFQRFKDLAEHKKEVFDEDLLALVDDAVLRTTTTSASCAGHQLRQRRPADGRPGAGGRGRRASASPPRATARSTPLSPRSRRSGRTRPRWSSTRCTRSPAAPTPRPRSPCGWRRTARP